ncbi:MAG: ribosome biogenesis GTPase Der [Puniceicoccales bacterium]|jgi:GTP-binding protein|nr:ribosome biogenesis GTPase Der [Puniceicoccales bacterium]
MKMFYNIAIVGRPNVGKSRLFNRLAHKRISIVHDMAGVTRDIITHEIGKNIILMDTGGLGLSGNDSIEEITSAVDEQVGLAIAAADLVLFVVDATEGIMPMDYDIAEMLRKSGANVTVIANKIDCHEKFHLADAFRSFGFGSPIAASAEHGIGEEEIERLIASKTMAFSSQLENVEITHNPIKLAFVGRPNVGKSSLVNGLLKEQRMIVSDIPGTTRETVGIKLPKCDTSGSGKDFELFDTAGSRPQNRITTSIDYFASLRTRDGIISCDIIFLVIDAESGITKLDKKLANEVIEAGKGLILVVNKWDIAQKRCRSGSLEKFDSIREFQESFLQAARKELRSFPDVEVAFVSARKGYGIDGLLPLAEKLYGRMNRKIGTGELNRVIQKAFARRLPSTSSGRPFRIYYAVQTGSMPFVFKCFCNRTSLLNDNYQKYLLNTLRKHFDFAGCTVDLEFVEKDRRFSKEKELTI